LKELGHRVTILADPVIDSANTPDLHDLRLASKCASRITWNWPLYKVWQKLSPSAMHHYMHRRALVEQIAQAVKQYGIQIVEIEESFGWAGWLQETLKIPVCVRLHGPWFEVGPRLGSPDDIEFRARIQQERRAILGAAGVSAPSRYTLEGARSYYGAPLTQSAVIPNPVEMGQALWELDRADPTRVLFVGRFDRLKGGDLIIDAFKFVLERIPEATLSFIGPDRGCLTDDGRCWSLLEYVNHRLPGAMESKRVEWLGQQPLQALASFRRRALLCVVCSLYETYSYTVAEAMALGCPVIAANAGGIPEIVSDQKNGLLHEAGNAEDLATKIVSLMQTPDWAARLGRQAATDCQKLLDPTLVAEKTCAFYHAIITK
jgi:glycosyltransferase involved in cell wall biosynthesis